MIFLARAVLSRMISLDTPALAKYIAQSCEMCPAWIVRSFWEHRLPSAAGETSLWWSPLATRCGSSASPLWFSLPFHLTLLGSGARHGLGCPILSFFASWQEPPRSPPAANQAPPWPSLASQQEAAHLASPAASPYQDSPNWSSALDLSCIQLYHDFCGEKYKVAKIKVRCPA